MYYFATEGDYKIMDLSSEEYAVIYTSEDGENWKKATIPYTEDNTREARLADAKTKIDELVNYINYYTAFTGRRMLKDTETVAGRECDKYYSSSDIIILEMDCVICIDKQTGICLKLHYAADTIVEVGGEVNYECTEFKTSFDVPIPENAEEAEIEIPEGVVTENESGSEN